jgi:D-tyrosyl-tRNA(Tyr) deacylase
MKNIYLSVKAYQAGQVALYLRIFYILIKMGLWWMIALIQRVASASAKVNGKEIAVINRGLLVFLGVEKNDGLAQADKLLKRILGYRIFEDKQGKMNLSVQAVAGGLLLVPQFTLAADTSSGMRPSFSSAAAADQAKQCFEYMLRESRKIHSEVAQGEFGADMQVSLINDGPVTFWLQVQA